MPDLRAALEAAIFAHPDEIANHAAYADYLSEQGDARGEFIQVQLALEPEQLSSKRREQLQKREKELLDAHQDEWLSPLTPHLVEKRPITDYRRENGLINRLTWRRGWLDEVRLWHPSVAQTRALARCDAARILRRLDLSHAGYEDDYESEPDDGIPEGSEYPSLHPLRKAAFLPHLRSLCVGERVDFHEESYNSEANGAGVAELVSLTPNLEELELYAWEVDLVQLLALPTLTRLRTLILYHHHDTVPLGTLADNPAFGALETLRVHPANTSGDPTYLPRSEVIRLLHSPHLAHLRNLHLHASDLGDQGCLEIIASGILKRLKILDLAHGEIRDAGATALIQCGDIQNLDLLDIGSNEISVAFAEEIIRPHGPKIEAGHQGEVGEQRYLWSGDME